MLDLRELRRGVLAELGVVLAALVVLAGLSTHGNVPGLVVRWSAAHRRLPLDHLVVLLAASHLLMIVFGARRGRQLEREFTQRRAAERELTHRAHHDGLTPAC